MDLRLIITRDPDRELSISAFVDGREVVPADEVVIDTGAGWTWADWTILRDESIEEAATVSPEYEAAVRKAFANPPGGRQYIEGKPDNEPWV